MKKQATTMIAIIVFLVSIISLNFASESPETLFYAYDSKGNQLITIDPNTGMGSPLVALKVPCRTHCLAFDPMGTLFGVDSDKDQLVTINADTGDVVYIGTEGGLRPAGIADVNICGLAFDLDGTLFAWESIQDLLLKIDPLTGTAIVVGSMEWPIHCSGLAIDWATGDLYALDDGKATVEYSTSGVLLRIDKATGRAIPIGPVGLDFHIVGVEFDPKTGDLYAVVNGKQFIKLDKTTGEGTVIGDIGDFDTATLATVYTPIIQATIDIDPDTLNLKSKGKWITCYIEFPEGYNVSDIDRTTILLNDTIPVDPFWINKPLESVIGDYDEDGVLDLMVKFDRASVIDLIKDNMDWSNHERTKPLIYKITLTVTGMLYDGTPLEGSDVIRTLKFLKGDPMPT
jgi:hypothetical protein